MTWSEELSYYPDPYSGSWVGSPYPIYDLLEFGKQRLYFTGEGYTNTHRVDSGLHTEAGMILGVVSRGHTSLTFSELFL